MKKFIPIVLKIVLSLLLISPILGALGLFPEPTRELYNTDQAYEFIMTLMNSGYINILMAIVFGVCFILIIKNKMAIVALLLVPITLNIVCFHLFLDGGIFTKGAIMGDVLFLINMYFLWQQRDRYRALL
jgi:putative oxidoreductase